MKESVFVPLPPSLLDPYEMTCVTQPPPPPPPKKKKEKKGGSHANADIGRKEGEDQGGKQNHRDNFFLPFFLKLATSSSLI